MNRLCDLVGFGVAVATGAQYVQNFAERTYISMLIPIMQEDKRAGRILYRLYLFWLTNVTHSFICLDSVLIMSAFGLPWHFGSGETTRKGFYVYNDKRKASPDPELKKFIQKAREISGVDVEPKVSLSLSLVVESL